MSSRHKYTETLTFEKTKFGQDNGDDLLSAIQGRKSRWEGGRGHDVVDLELLEGRYGVRYNRFGFEKLLEGGGGEGGEGGEGGDLQHPRFPTSRRLLQTSDADADNAANEELVAAMASYQNKVAAMPNDKRQAFVQVFVCLYVCV